MRLLMILAMLLGLAAPAAAETPSHLKSLEQQLRYIEAANPGNVGIAALDLSSGDMVSIHGDEPFPMASVVKIAIAAQYLAQVNQGHVADVGEVHEKLQYDFFYIKYFSPWLDLLILFRTIKTMLTGFGSR